jgi:hypothetical protein
MHVYGEPRIISQIKEDNKSDSQQTTTSIGHEDSVGLSVCVVNIFAPRRTIYCYPPEKEGVSKEP